MDEEKNKEGGEKSAAEEERARREEILKQDLGIASRKVRERFTPPLHEMVASATEDMPEDLKERVMRRFEKIKDFSDKIKLAALSEEELKELQENGVPEEKIRSIRERQNSISSENVESFLKQQVDIITAEVRSAFMAEMGKDQEGKQIMMLNKGFAKFEAQQRICDILEKDPSPEALKRVARISFDLNGLKAVNDLNASHEQGDAYLLLVKKSLEDPEVLAFAKEKGLNYIATRDGGDEFGLIVTSDKAIEADALNELQKRIEDKLSSDQEAAKCLDFSDEKTLLHYNRVTGDEEKAFYAKPPEEREAILAKYRSEIPEGFQFRAFISGGASTLYDAMLDPLNDKDGDNRINEGEDSGRILKKMMGCMFGSSDARMQANKDRFKASLAVGNPHEKMMAMIYTRTDKEKELKRELDSHDAIMEAAEEMERAGIDEAIRNKFIADKERELWKKKKEKSQSK